jgi:hypothetical protein
VILRTCPIPFGGGRQLGVQPSCPHPLRIWNLISPRAWLAGKTGGIGVALIKVYDWQRRTDPKKEARRGLWNQLKVPTGRILRLSGSLIEFVLRGDAPRHANLSVA